MANSSIISKRKWSPIFIIGISLLFFAALGSFVAYAFFLSVFSRREAPNWGIFGFGFAIWIFVIYLFLKWIPNLTTLIITDDDIVEIGVKGRKVILINDIISLNPDDQTLVSALWVKTSVTCATIRSAEKTITFMYGNYNNAEDIQHALEKIAHRKGLTGLVS